MDDPRAKITLAIINACLAVTFVMTGAFYLGLYTDFATEDGAMRWIVGSTIFLVSDLAFIVIIIFLFIVGQKTDVSTLNRLSPIVAIPLFSVAPFTEVYDSLTGPITDHQIAHFGVVFSLLFAGLAIFEAMKGRKGVT